MGFKRATSYCIGFWLKPSYSQAIIFPTLPGTPSGVWQVYAGPWRLYSGGDGDRSPIGAATATATALLYCNDDISDRSPILQ